MISSINQTPAEDMKLRSVKTQSLRRRSSSSCIVEVINQKGVIPFSGIHQIHPFVDRFLESSKDHHVPVHPKRTGSSTPASARSPFRIAFERDQFVLRLVK